MKRWHPNYRRSGICGMHWHQPPDTRPYQSRVFFTRQWTDPDGATFGKRGLHVVTIEKFRRLCRGYAHEFEMVEPAQPQVAPVAIDKEDARIQAAFEGREVPA